MVIQNIEGLIKSTSARDRRDGVRGMFHEHPDMRNSVLAPLLYDPDEDVSYLSARALQGLRSPEIVNFIKKNAFGRINRAVLAGFLLDGAHHPEFFDIEYRPQNDMHRTLHIANLAKQYRKDRAAEIFAHLEGALDDSSPAIREAAYRALSRIGTEEAVKLFLSKFREEDDGDAAVYGLDLLSHWMGKEYLPYRIPPDKRDSILGSMYGLLTGDALGAAPEFMDRAQIENIFGRVTDFQPDLGRDLAPGEYTDDGEMTLFTLDFMMNHVYSPQGLAEFLAEKIKMIETRELKWRGYGGTTRMTLRRIGAGTNYRQTDTRKKKGCGAAMRILPIAIAYHEDDLEGFRHDVVQASNITHTSDESVSGALAIAYVARKVLRGETVDAPVLDEVEGFIQPYESMMSERLRDIRQYLDRPTQEGVDALDDADTRTAITVPLALYIFLKEQDSVENCVIYGANTAGDSDSIASMAGGLAGLKNGMTGIPDRFRDRVNDSYLVNITK